MKVGFLQFEPKLLEAEENIDRILSLIEKAEKFDLLVMPELANSGYVFVDKKELNRAAEEIPSGIFCQALIELSANRNAYIVSGVCEKEGSKFFNSSILVGPEGYMGTYRKVHLFDREKLFFEAGRGPFKVYNIGEANIGLLICFDWIFPEVSRILALEGADILCHSANLVLPYSQRAMLARSVENKVFSITANRIGTENNGDITLTFTGESQVTSPTMEILAKAGEKTCEIKIVEIDPKIAKNKWLNQRNNLFKDRHPELYEKLVK
ncbi:MAG: nitrilase-related carbon-nitrogen hydrolase [Candidatus Heimdallarchaeaceae archaeon]